MRANPDGSVLRLGEVARVEIGSEAYGFVSRFNREPATGVAISLATGANALDTAEGVQAQLEQLKPYFPAGLTSVTPLRSASPLCPPFHRLLENSHLIHLQHWVRVQ